MKINLTAQGQQRSSDVIIMLSSLKSLLPVLRFKEEHPQAVLVHPEEGGMVNLTSTFLSGLSKVEGLSIEEFMKKALNADTEFAYKPEDDDKAQNRKDT